MLYQIITNYLNLFNNFILTFMHTHKLGIIVLGVMLTITATNAGIMRSNVTLSQYDLHVASVMSDLWLKFDSQNEVIY